MTLHMIQLQLDTAGFVRFGMWRCSQLHPGQNSDRETTRCVCRYQIWNSPAPGLDKCFRSCILRLDLPQARRPEYTNIEIHPNRNSCDIAGWECRQSPATHRPQ